mgnify:CR=1 FL=1
MKGTLLYIEDDYDQSRSLTLLLEKQGWEVYPFLDAIEAIQNIQQGLKYDLVLSDILLPGADIGDIICASKKLHPEKPIITLAAWSYPHPKIAASFIKGERNQSLLSFLQKYAK